MCYKCRGKGHLTRKCPHTGNSTITQGQQTPPGSTSQTSCTGCTLCPATNPTFSQTTTAKTPITAELWQTLMEQLNKVNKGS